MLSGLQDPATFWLTVTNIVLGATTALCFLLVVGAVGVSLVARARARLQAQAPLELHALHVPGLGVTMADGGEPVDEASESESKGEKRR